MSKSTSWGLLVVTVVALVVAAYAHGRWSAKHETSTYAYDLGTHLTLSCINEHVVALTDIREGRTDDAVRGLELLVTAKLESIDPARIPDTIVAKKSLESLRTPLQAYQKKFPTTTLDAKKNPRLENVMRELKVAPQ
jgi:hypothetical protein